MPISEDGHRLGALESDQPGFQSWFTKDLLCDLEQITQPFYQPTKVTDKGYFLGLLISGS